MKIPTDFRITYYGIEHEQYWQGHGTSFTKWADCATGIGCSNKEALDDALDSLAQNGWDVETLEAMMARLGSMPSDKPDHHLPDDCHYYVAVDVK